MIVVVCCQVTGVPPPRVAGILFSICMYSYRSRMRKQRQCAEWKTNALKSSECLGSVTKGGNRNSNPSLQRSVPPPPLRPVSGDPHRHLQRGPVRQHRHPTEHRGRASSLSCRPWATFLQRVQRVVIFAEIFCSFFVIFPNLKNTCVFFTSYWSGGNRCALGNFNYRHIWRKPAFVQPTDPQLREGSTLEDFRFTCIACLYFSFIFRGFFVGVAKG